MSAAWHEWSVELDDIHGNGLTSSLGTYDDYKRTTRIVIKWLQDNGAVCEEDRTTTTCRGLLRLAENIGLKGIVASREIASAFAETLALRNHLNKWFRGQEGLADEEANKRHEVFNEVLQTIYDSLRIAGSPSAARPKKKHINISDSASSSPEPLLNRYEHLYDASDSDNDPETPTQHARADVQPKVKQPSIPSKTESMVLDFDFLMEDMVMAYVEVFQALINLDGILCVVKSTWSEATQGIIPVTTAAAVSQLAWSWALEYINVLSHCYWAQNLKTFKMCIRNLRLSRLPPGWTEDDMPRNTSCAHGDGIHLALYVVDVYMKNPSCPQSMPVFRAALDKISPTQDREKDGRAMKLLLQCMKYHETEELPFDYNTSVNMRMVKDELDPANRHPDKVKVAFYLRFLLEIHRSYLYPSPASGEGSIPSIVRDGTTQPVTSVPTINPRLRLLKFAQEVADTMKVVSKHDHLQKCCSGALAGKTAMFSDELNDMIRSPQFGLYFQNPTIAGDIMLSIYDISRDVGKDLSNHRHYIASILHVYNALCAMDDIKAIPLLDELCDIFLDIIFLGQRPKWNFSSPFVRHRGGVPQYSEPTGLRGHDLGSNSAWAMKVKDVDNQGDADHREVNFKRFEDSVDQSVLANTMLSGAHTVDWYWAKVLGQKNQVHCTDKDIENMTNWVQSHGLKDHPLLYLKKVLAQEWHGEHVPYVDIAAHLASVEMDDTGSSTMVDGHSNPNSPSCDCCDCKRDSDILKGTSPRIRLKITRPDCPCHRNTSRLRTITKERLRGTGLLPVIRLNYGALWVACADAFAAVNKSGKHKKADGGESGEDGANPITCLCLVDSLLMDADVWMGREKKSMKFPSPKLKKKWIKVIETFRAKSAEDFLWKWL